MINGGELKPSYCLQKTRLTIFIDSPRIGEALKRLYSQSYRYLVLVIKSVLRDPCYQGRLYDQLDRKFIEITNNGENFQSDFEKVFRIFKQTERDEIYNFVEEFRP